MSVFGAKSRLAFSVQYSNGRSLPGTKNRHAYYPLQRIQRSKQSKIELVDSENGPTIARWKRCCGWPKSVKGMGQEVQTSSYKISYGDVTYSMVTIVNNIILQV